MTAPRIGSLCTGYNGLDMAVQEVFGGAVAWVADIDPGACQILARIHPDVPNLGDISAVQYADVEPVDILTAGFPCQDLSLAGLRAGLTGDTVIPAGVMHCGCDWANHDATGCAAASPSGYVPSRLTGDAAARAVADLNARDLADPAGPPPERVVKGTRSGLWHQVARAIRELRPALVVIENVRGLLSADGHGHVEPCTWCVGDERDEPVLRALGVVLADLAELGFDAEWVGLPASAVGAPHERFRVFLLAWPADTARPGWAGAWIGGDRWPALAGQAGRQVTAGHAAADAEGDGWDEGRTEPARVEGGPDAALGGASDQQTPADAESFGHGDTGAPSIGGLPATAVAGDSATGLELRWGVYEPAIRRWEHVLGRPAPSPVDALGRLSPPFVEWMQGLCAGHVTDTPGLSRTAHLKALGNGVVPQQAVAAIRMLRARVLHEAAEAAA